MTGAGQACQLHPHLGVHVGRQPSLCVLLQAIERGTSYTVIPWQMGIVAKVLRLLPNAVYDWAFSKAPHKPRKVSP